MLSAFADIMKLDSMNKIFTFIACIFGIEQVLSQHFDDSRIVGQKLGVSSDDLNGLPQPNFNSRPLQSLHPGLLPNPGDIKDPFPGNSVNEVWASTSSDTPQIKAINVQCEKNQMRVNLQFDKPFYGTVFSKGHYSDPNCVHMPPGKGVLDVNFDIFPSSCGMTSSGNFDEFGQPSIQGSYVENTVIIQYDPLVQEVWDQARKLRCTWYDFYEKSVALRPFQVDSLSAVTANFLGDNLQCWMQIQIGKGPWAQEVSGIVKIGQTMTLVLAIKDEENKFDMLVRNCVAHDGQRAPIQLVDGQGCVTRPKIMRRFHKIRNFGPSATVASYAYFQAFKFPDSMNVHFQCVIQVCRFSCPDPECPGDPIFAASESQHVPLLDPRTPNHHIDSQKLKFAAENGFEDREETDDREGYLAVLGGRPRSLNVSLNNDIFREKRHSRSYRSTEMEVADVETSRTIQVVAPGDVTFNLNSPNDTVVVSSSSIFDPNGVCLSLAGFVAGMVMLLLVLAVTSLVAIFMVIRIRSVHGQKSASNGFGHQQFGTVPEYIKSC